MIEIYLKLFNPLCVFDMCQHSHFVYNPYSRKSLLVKCGKCPSCLQEKAFARATRIKNNHNDGTIALFFTLTYSNDYLPYIRKSDVFGDSCSEYDLPIYRNSTVRQIFNPHTNSLNWKKEDNKSIISYVCKADIDFDDLDKLTPPTGMDKDCVSVCWYPDIQKFYKRLRVYLQRKYNYEKPFSYFSCSEYGSDKKRSHFHGLLFIAREDEALFRSAVIEAWPYADKSRTAKFIEVARDASNYVASYVNSPARLSSTLSCDYFKQKHTQSKNFGVVLDCFSLRSILEKIDNGDLSYYRKQKFDGESAVVDVPIPLYVLHRYFPKFKGFSWLDTSQLHAILLDPQKVGDILTDYEYKATLNRDIYDYSSYNNSFDCSLHLSNYVPIRRQCKLINPLYHFTPIETYRIYVRLENAFQYFHSKTGLSRFDYAHYFERVYNLYFSNIMKNLHKDVVFVDDYDDFYDNGFEVLDNPELAPTLLNKDIVADPNKRSFVVNSTKRNYSLFSRMSKQRDVTNYVMNQLGYEV